jgi:uncharacterized cupredoxin-like copper-binding protein
MGAHGVRAIVALALVGMAACGGGARASAGHETVVITVHHSKFVPSAVRVRPGATVRFVVHNTDPIEHELIVGDEATQHVHEIGTDVLHQGPGAVSVAPGTTAETIYTFPRAGTLLYGCHLPGHWAYGMRGTIAIIGLRPLVVPPSAALSSERPPSSFARRPPLSSSA